VTCDEFQDWLQRRLDGAPPEDGDALDRHLAGCPDCREWHAAARRLEEGLRLLPAVTVPADLAGRVAGRVRGERRVRLRRRVGLAASLALAACLVLALLLGRGRTRPEAPTMAGHTRPPASEAPPESLRDSVTEAGSAVVGLTRRTADETVGQTKLLLPVVVARPNLGDGGVPATVEPPMRSLRAAGQGVSEGLEPVTTSARRALNLFLSEMPPVESEVKQGS
jgi:predicted anti-sigma-YlaC factor YlaD